MDSAFLGGRLPEVTQKPLLGSSCLSLQCQHWESSKVLAGLVFCEMLPQCPQSAFQGSSRAAGRGGRAPAVCDPNPPHPFARSTHNIFWGQKKWLEVNFPSRGSHQHVSLKSYKNSLFSNPSFFMGKQSILRERESYFQGKLSLEEGKLSLWGKIRPILPWRENFVPKDV